jgi:hypothetical protein
MHMRILASAVAVLALTACSPDTLAGAVGAVASATGRLAGTVYLPNDQVAIVAQGAGNIVAQGAGNAQGDTSMGGFQPGFGLLARSDEKGVDGAKVVVTGTSGTTYTGFTAGGGKFAIDCPQGTYQASATFTTTSKGTITLTGYGANALASTLDIDVAMNTVASKIAQGGAKLAKVDASKVKDAVSKAANDLQSVPRTPTPTTQAEAATAFDGYASADTKAAVQAIIDAAK